MKSVYSSSFLSCALTTALLAGCGSASEAEKPDQTSDAGDQQSGDAASPDGDSGTSGDPTADAGGDAGSSENPNSDAGGGESTDAGSANGDAGVGNENDAGNGGESDAGADPDNPLPGDASGTRFFLPTTEPDNTAAPRIKLDAAGGIHALYPAYAGGGAYYTYCPADCNGADDMHVVYLPTDGTVANAMLVLTKDGNPRVLLSGFLNASYATCDDDCSDEENWNMEVIVTHGSDKEITGEALALDPEGHPHFTMHTYRALFGIGQLPPKTEYASCYADDCTVASAWEYAPLSDQIWEDAQLEFDADGMAHLAFVADVMQDKIVTERFAAYAQCAGNCATIDDWPSIGLAHAYADDSEVVSIKPTISLALTSTGKPRLLAFAVSDTGEKNLDYFECDADCMTNGFVGNVLSNYSELGAGLDLALDAQDRPRFVHTLNYNIALGYCDELPCAAADAHWDLTMIEAAGTIPKDNIFLYPNCYVGAWFLHSPSIALTADGEPRVGYQARDISGGLGHPDGPNTPDCEAGTDMTWSRLAILNSYQD